MAIEIKTIQQLHERIINQLILSCNAGQLDRSKQVDANIRNSALGAMCGAMAAGFDENNDFLRQILIQLFPHTATDIYLEMWAAWFGITRLAAFKASGNVVFTGVAGASIPTGTLVKRADDTQFETVDDFIIAASTISVSGITRSSSTATATTATAHGLATGMSVTIAGANQTEYNITATITVTSETTFTFTVSGTPTTPATGTITASFTAAFVTVIASEYGIDANTAGGSQFALVSPLPDIDDACFLDYPGLSGGLDAEEDEDLRIRLLERTSSFTAPFTSGGIPIFVKQNVPGVTRMWVQSATPSAGYVTIYFTRDKDANIIPSSARVLDVKNAIIDDDTGIKPANVADAYVVVAAPTAVPVAVTFSSLTPNSVDMQTAITDALTDFFKSSAVSVATNLKLDDLKGLIRSVLDSSGTQPVFTLSAPSGDTTISTGELATLGTITWA